MKRVVRQGRDKTSAPGRDGIVLRVAQQLRPLLLSLSSVSLAVATMAAGAEVFTRAPRPGNDAPNVLIVMTDDVGFAASSTLGGGIPTPVLDELAADGLIYNNFYTTGVCSPTRAALLTGRNAHAVGFGTVTELARPERGYSSIIPKSAASVARVLSDAGYDTAMIGKHHNVPTWQAGPLGPFNQWASGLGFGYFYGFHGGFVDQFAPQLIENTRMISPALGGDYILDRYLADKAIAWLKTQRTQHSGTPFFMYYAPGTAHSPLQAPAAWIARFRGQFDQGWDVYRLTALRRQKELGLVPTDTQLAPMPGNLSSWQAMSADERRVAARYMEVYAAMLAHFDAQLGRIVAELKQSGQYDNTLIIFIQGDNGASGEGGESGALNYLTRVSGHSTAAGEVAHASHHLSDLGGPRSYAIGPAGWGVAMNTPFPFYKVVASRLGALRNGMVITWPRYIDKRGVRNQFSHVTDIMPTVLAATGTPLPGKVDGVAQQLLDGVSLLDSFNSADTPSFHHTQYFEVFGNGAIYHQGWLLAKGVKINIQRGSAVADPDVPWQLYNLTTDFSQRWDVAANYPDKVAELSARWEAEAVRNHVLPLTSSNIQSMLGGRPEPLAKPGRYTFYPSQNRYPEGVFPNLNNRHWTDAADLIVPTEGAQGVLVTQGGRPAGWALAMLESVPTFYYRASDRKDALLQLAAPQSLPAGRYRITVSFRIDGPGFGRGGDVVLEVDGEPVASGRVKRTVPFKFAQEDATIGYDSGTAISDDYMLPFAFTGTLDKVVIETGQVLSLERR